MAIKRKSEKSVVVNIVPTGIKCKIGGFIGDATKVTNLLATVCDWLITNPNAVNAGAFNFKARNVLCVEGFAIDLFFKNKIGLLLTEKNTIGIIIEEISDKISLKMVLKTIEAFSVVCGIEISGIEFVKPVKKRIRMINNQFCGEISDIEPILQAAENLQRRGASAIAITTHIPEKIRNISAYQGGKFPNPYGQMEALISHAIINYLKIPAAHGPLLTKREMEYFLFRSFHSDPRSAFENISSAYLGSVLIGLSNAPQLTENWEKADIILEDVKALIIPKNCFRSIPVAFAFENLIPIIEVKENENIFQPLSKSDFLKSQKIFSVKDYQQAYDLLKKIS